MDLTQKVDQFLDERLGLGMMTVRQATRYRFRLVGDPTFSIIPLGYARFLKASGVRKPTLQHINAHYVGRYWEFLTQHHGGLQAAWAMQHLGVFWKWCIANRYIVNRKMPPDLKSTTTNNFYRIRTRIKER